MEYGVDCDVNSRFLIEAVRELAGIDRTDGLTTLDFGCGRGALVRALRQRGLDARGCDFPASLDPEENLDAITPDPYCAGSACLGQRWLLVLTHEATSKGTASSRIHPGQREAPGHPSR
jgi:hypothetical protein